jgi:hypothetical protein
VGAEEGALRERLQPVNLIVCGRPYSRLNLVRLAEWRDDVALTILIEDNPDAIISLDESNATYHSAAYA